jgi:hypothetical protein
MKRLTIVPLVVLALTPLARATAQEQPPPVEPGDRVRVHAPDCRLYQQPTTFEAWRGDTLIAVADSSFGAATLSCPLASIWRLEMSQGQKSNALKGLLIGSPVGAVIGAVVGILGSQRETPTSSDPHPEAIFCYEGTAACAARYALAVGAFGGLVGLPRPGCPTTGPRRAHRAGTTNVRHHP